MFRILEARFLAPEVKYFRISAPWIARKQRAGQFVILRATAEGERIPLTIADSDLERGWIALVVQGVGKTTRLLNTFEAGERIADLAGPLGNPTEIRSFGTVVAIGGGVGTAVAYPSARALKRASNQVISIVGGRSRRYVILEEEMRRACDEVYPTTDDGTYGLHGVVTDRLRNLLNDGRKIDLVLAAGPIPMMQAVASLTRPAGIRTMVSLNPIMIDGTGMCGGCRVRVGGKICFACVDGPEFNAHEVDFDLLTRRNRAYRDFEKMKLEEFDHKVSAGGPCQ